jgi:four helix bundle protein
MKTHKDLDVWKHSINLVVDIYKATCSFPKEEIYGITSQMRRAAVSITSNISEGAGRKTPREFLRFLQISSGSLSELETQVIIAKQLNFIKEPEYSKVVGQINSIRAQLTGLERAIQRKINP